MKKLVILFVIVAVVGIGIYFYLKNKKSANGDTVTVPELQPDGTVIQKVIPAPTKETIEMVKRATHGKG
jgi:uncharacterized protein (UPF0333 family)